MNYLIFLVLFQKEEATLIPSSNKYRFNLRLLLNYCKFLVQSYIYVNLIKKYEEKKKRKN